MERKKRVKTNNPQVGYNVLTFPRRNASNSAIVICDDAWSMKCGIVFITIVHQQIRNHSNIQMSTDWRTENAIDKKMPLELFLSSSFWLFYLYYYGCCSRWWQGFRMYIDSESNNQPVHVLSTPNQLYMVQQWSLATKIHFCVYLVLAHRFNWTRSSKSDYFNAMNAR